jgi:hypothetical protein
MNILAMAHRFTQAIRGAFVNQPDAPRGLSESSNQCHDRDMILRWAIDHHLLRDPEWRTRIKEVQEKGAEKRTQIITAAEFAVQEIF